MLATTAASSKGIFVAATNNTNQTNKAGRISLSLLDVWNINTYAYIFSWAAKRVISWSSLDWDRGRWNQLDLVKNIYIY